MQNARRTRRKWVIGGVFLALAVVLAAFFLLRGRSERLNAQAAATAESGEVVAAFIGDLAETATASGQLVPRQQAVVSAAVPGIVTEVLVRPGDTVQAGDSLLQLDTTDLVAGVTAAEQNLTLQQANLAALREPAAAADIAAAEASLRSAQLRLEDLLAPPSEQDTAAWQADIQSQEANLASANANLSGTLNSVGDAAIEAARAQVASAEIAVTNARAANEANPNVTTDSALQDAEYNLVVARAELNALLAGPAASSVGASAASVAAAQANLERTLANYEAFLAGPTAAQIASAEAGLAGAESTLANLLEGASAESIAVAEAQVTQAEINLANAQAVLAEATVRAPFAGVITAVNYVEGELASGPAVSLIAAEYLVVLAVDEIDIGAVAIGQPAEITLETWPDRPIPAEVAHIAPTANVSVNGLVTYEVQLRLDQSDLPVRAGMTANAELITANRKDVLLVPNGAIRADRQNDRYYVNLANTAADGGRTFREIEVDIGLRDNDFTQVTAGLAAGDEVLIGALTVPEVDFGGGPFGR